MRAAEEEVADVAENEQDQQRRGKTMPLVAEPIGDRAAGRRHQIVEQPVVVMLDVNRAGQEQRDQTGEDEDRHPVPDRFHAPLFL